MVIGVAKVLGAHAWAARPGGATPVAAIASDRDDASRCAWPCRPVGVCEKELFAQWIDWFWPMLLKIGWSVKETSSAPML